MSELTIRGNKFSIDIVDPEGKSIESHSAVLEDGMITYPIPDIEAEKLFVIVTGDFREAFYNGIDISKLDRFKKKYEEVIECHKKRDKKAKKRMEKTPLWSRIKRLHP